MVVSKDAKRKRKESPIIKASSIEVPKRTKVQAQRKFAQGQSAPTSSYTSAVAAASSSASGTPGTATGQGLTPIRENREPPPELIPHKRPKTEDFLTFLCFRGTSVLPSHLDFLNQNKNKNNSTVVGEGVTAATSAAGNKNEKKNSNDGNEIVSNSIPTAGASTSNGNKTKDKSSSSTVLNVATTSTVEVSKMDEPDLMMKDTTPIIPFAVRKRADQVPEGNRKQKANAKNTKSSRDSITVSNNKKEEPQNRRSPRTRTGKIDSISATSKTIQTVNNGNQVEESDNDDETAAKEEEVCNENNTDKEKGKRTPIGKGRRQPPAAQKNVHQNTNKKNSTVGEKTNPVKQNSEIVKPTAENGTKPKKGRKKPQSPIETPPDGEVGGGRMTRQRAFFEPVKVPVKENSITNASVQKTNEDDVKNEEESERPDFSSDDEQPLAKTIKPTTKRTVKRNQGRGKRTIKADKSQVNNSESNSATPTPEKKTKLEINSNNTASIKNRRNVNKTNKDVSEKDSEIVNESQSLRSDLSPKPRNKRGRKNASTKGSIAPPPVSGNKEKSDLPSEDDTFGRLSPKKSSEKKETDPDHSQCSQTDLSENETKTGRPTRKTKEAATIYMELIGQKLNLDAFDDDDSINSYPELPNVKKAERVENELRKANERAKQNVKQPKKKVIAEKKKVMNKKTAKSEPEKEVTITENEFELEENKTKSKEKEEKATNQSGQRKQAVKRKSTTSIIGEKTVKMVLEKSFSDSDDEPLATKVKPNDRELEDGRKRRIESEEDEGRLVIDTESKSLTKENSSCLTNDEKLKSGQTHKLISASVFTATTSEEQTGKLSGTQVTTNHGTVNFSSVPITPTNKQLPKSPITSNNKTEGPCNLQPSSPTVFPPIDRFPSPKINPTFLTPKYDRNLERRLPVETNPTASLQLKGNQPQLAASPLPAKADLSVPKANSPGNVNSPSGTKTVNPIESLLSANLMPSKEESGKIFGIASVSLAQSSGPDNTKCTLGKCGSIHKEVLGPVVPTEAYLGEQLSGKERRKAKVNMTHEQIQKWLIECSSNPDDIQDFIDDDFDEHLKPMTFAPTPPPIGEEKDSSSLSSSSKQVKDNLEGKIDSVWLGKGPSLKATPVMVKEDIKQQSSTDLIKNEETTNDIDNISAKDQQQQQNPIDKKKTSTSIQKLTKNNIKSSKQSNSSVATSSPKPKKSSSSPKEMKVAAKKQTAAVTRVQKRQTVYSSKIAEAAKKKPVMTNSFTAFSAENETSVYSFDKEDDVPPPVAKSFRRQNNRRESHTEEQLPQKTEKEKQQTQPQQSQSSTKDAQQQSSVSLTLSPEENSKLIKVSLDGGAAAAGGKSAAERTPGNDIGVINDSDSEGHTFYIPLQGLSGNTGNSSGNSSDDLIQGVAVKLGREGPDGPNQRVIMHATLVTKAQMGSNTTPIPDSMNIHEIVKSLLSTSNTKESITQQQPLSQQQIQQQQQQQNPTTAATGTSGTSKSVPVGTVQPRFKSSSNNEQQQTQNQNPSSSGLTRVNSNSSLLSGSNKSRSGGGPTTGAKRLKDDIPIKMCNNTVFPRRDDPAQMVEAPIFRPTEKEFHDPIEFIERITPIAARFGICKIIPPSSFKPECRVSDDMRFTAYNQYVHKMLHRWGPSAKELSAIKKYLATQSIAMSHPPWIGGMEVDLPRLYHTVQELGGLKEVIEKKKWAKVAEEMCIPKLAQDRVTKLDDIYCKYLLPYDTLSPIERQKLFDEVEADWAKREARARRNADRCVNLESVSNEDDDLSSGDDDDESEDEIDGVSMECIVKGRSMPLSAFYRIARNTMALWFKNTEPTVADIEAEFWRHVAVRDSHVCVHSGSIDSSGWGYGFPTPGPKAKGSTCARHPWNLKVLTNNSGSVLRSLGPVMGVTVPTLHVGMLFSACCWYRDPHGLSWIEYLHTGASKIWYGIPDEQSSNFRSALTTLIPTHCQNKTIWLPCDTVMVPPHMLTDRGVSLCRIEQKPGEFVVIFPRAYTSSLATGYVVSESVYFATSSWLESAKEDFKDIHESCEPAMFSLEQLLFAVAIDPRAVNDVLLQILPMLTEVYEKEVAARQQLKASGVTSTEKIQTPAQKSKQKVPITEDHECDLCRANLYISMVKTEDGNIYCLQHALKNINNSNMQAKQCKLIYKYNIEEIESIVKKLKEKFDSNQQKKSLSNVAATTSSSNKKSK